MMSLNFAVLIVDRPFVDQKHEYQLAPGTCLKDIVPKVLNKPGLAYVLLVNGQVADLNYCVKGDDQIVCVPQIAGG